MGGRAYKEVEKAKREVREERQLKGLSDEAGEVGWMASKIMLNKRLRGATAGPTTGRRPGVPPSDRFSYMLANGMGVEGLRLPLKGEQFMSLHHVFAFARREILRKNKMLFDIKFEHGVFKVPLPGPKVVEVEGAELGVEYLKGKGGSEAAVEALYLIKRTFDLIGKRRNDEEEYVLRSPRVDETELI